MNEKLELLSAAELGRLVNAKKIKPTEVIRYFEKRIIDRNESINAFVYTKMDEAMEIAARQEKMLENGEEVGPFAGVPFALKDFLPNKPGWTNSHGGVLCLLAVDDCQSVFCEAIEKAGGIAVGKTNAPSYGFRGTTYNRMYGATSTPFNSANNSGGSSGGSAAAVADGLVPIAEGGDAGGSIRIPAAFNNLFGFKAGIGTIPSVARPDAFSATHPFCFNGALTKTVEDTAILMNYIGYFNCLDPYSRPGKIDYVQEMQKDIKGMKIAYTKDFDIFEIEPAVEKQFRRAVEDLKKLGVTTTEVHFDFKHTAKEMADWWCKGITVDCAIDLNLRKEQGVDLLTEHEADFPEEFIYWKKECDKLGIQDLYEFNLVRTDVLDQFEKVLKDYDFIASPVSCVAAIQNSTDKNTKGPDKINGKTVEPLIGWTETFLANFVGNPSASIPAGMIDEKTPFGLQLTGKRFHDGELLALCHAFEKLKPWREYYTVALNRKLK